MVIVYRSNTGFTREYAEMLGRAEKIKVYSVTEAERSLESGTEIFYMGPLMAGHIEGVDQAVKRYQVRGVCGVGLSPSGRQVLETISRANYVPNAPIFYLQGGWAPKKVSWLKRRMWVWPQNLCGNPCKTRAAAVPLRSRPSWICW